TASVIAGSGIQLSTPTGASGSTVSLTTGQSPLGLVGVGLGSAVIQITSAGSGASVLIQATAYPAGVGFSVTSLGVTVNRDSQFVTVVSGYCDGPTRFTSLGSVVGAARPVSLAASGPFEFLGNVSSLTIPPADAAFKVHGLAAGTGQLSLTATGSN